MVALVFSNGIEHTVYHPCLETSCGLVLSQRHLHNVEHVNISSAELSVCIRLPACMHLCCISRSG